jgi:tetratricopeptide (TPR) repeat protein
MKRDLAARWWQHSFALAVAVVAVALLATVARPRLGSAAEDDKLAAKAHFETATRFYDLREYAKALDEYKAAYMAKPDPAFLFNIGQCYRKLGKKSDALEFFNQYLKKAPADDPNRQQVEARMRDLEAESDGAATATPAHTIAPAPTPSAVPAPVTIPPPMVPPPVASPPGVQPDGLTFAAPAPAQAEVSERPFYKTWWLWTGVGVVVAGAVTVAVLASRGGGTDVPHTALGSQPVLP